MSGPAALAPFRSRNFRFQWPADLLTAWALEMETLILGWYVLVQTGSVVMLSIFAALQLSGSIFSPMIGVLADRHGTRNVLAMMRFGYATFAGILLYLAATQQLDPYLALVFSALSGLLRPSDIGIRTALCGATVPAEDLTAAMGISRTTQDSARIAGALAGAGFLASFGLATAYTVISLIYLAGAVLTLLVGVSGAVPRPLAEEPSQRPSPWRELREGLSLVWNTPRLLASMSYGALVNLTAFPLTGGLMPYVARDVYHLDQRGLGMLVACIATGAFVGSISLSLLGSRVRPARMMLGAGVIWYLALLGFAFSTYLPLALVLLFVAGVAQSMSMVALVIMLLRTTEPEFRGRIMGVRMLAIYTLPFAILLAGALIPQIGFRATAVIYVVLGLLATLEIAVSWRHDLLRRDSPANAR